MDYTPGPWAIDDSGVNAVSVCGHRIKTAEVYSVKSIAWVAQVRNYNDSADARLIAAAPDLLEAAKLTALHFKRNRDSGNFQGDDEHEAWNALEQAIQKAEPK